MMATRGGGTAQQMGMTRQAERDSNGLLACMRMRITEFRLPFEHA